MVAKRLRQDRNMFTGLITDVGEVAARDGGRFQIRAHYLAAEIAVGAST